MRVGVWGAQVDAVDRVDLVDNVARTRDRPLRLSNPSTCAPTRRHPPVTHTPIDARQLFHLECVGRSNWRIGDQKQIMHPPATIIAVFLCVAFCLRQTEFDPALMVSRSLDVVSRRRKR